MKNIFIYLFTIVLPLLGIPQSKANNGTCTDPYTITLGETVKGSFNGAKNSITNYWDNTWDYSGADIIYKLTLTEETFFDLRVRGNSSDIEFFILNNSFDCNADIALEEHIEAYSNSSSYAGFNYQSISTTLSPGEYYIVLEGVIGSRSKYILEFLQYDTDSKHFVAEIQGTVKKPTKIFCGNVVTGDNESGVNLFNKYGDLVDTTYNAIETVYTFDLKQKTFVEIYLEMLSGFDLNLFLGKKVMNGEKVEYTFLSFEDTYIESYLEQGTYFIFVDGINAGKSDFELSLNCYDKELINENDTRVELTVVEDFICSGSVYELGDQELTKEGYYQDTVALDSVVQLTLSKAPSYDETYTIKLDAGKTFPFGNRSYDLFTSGLYKETFVTQQGCDSVVTLYLNIGDTTDRSKRKPVGISKVEPLAAISGDTILIYGNGFGTNENAITVAFGKTRLHPAKATENVLKVLVPPAANVDKVIVPITVDITIDSVKAPDLFTIIREQPQQSSLVYGHQQDTIFQSNIKGNSIYSVAPADLNNDRYNDVVAFYNENIVWIPNESGKGDFKNAKTIFSGIKNSLGKQYAVDETSTDQISSIFAKDVDFDGDIDIIASPISTDDSTYQFYWFENQNNGTFVPQKIQDVLGNSKFQFYPSDLDQDGDIDIVISTGNSTSGESFWLENRGTDATDPNHKAWYQHDLFKYYTDAIEVADMNIDGRMDIIFSIDVDNSGTHELYWADNNGYKSFDQFYFISDEVFSAQIKAGDIDNDGDIDIVTSKFYQVEAYINEEKGTSWSEAVILTKLTGASNIDLVDLNGDGWLDLLSSSKNAIKRAINRYYVNQEFRFDPQTVVSDGLETPLDVFGTDMDGDGDLDILTNEYWDQTIFWYENQSLTTPILGDATQDANEPKFTLTWDTVDYANRYEVQLAYDEGFTNIYSGFEDAKFKVNKTEATIEDVLQPTDGFYWRIKAINDDRQESFYSESLFEPAVAPFEITVQPVTEASVETVNNISLSTNYVPERLTLFYKGISQSSWQQESIAGLKELTTFTDSIASSASDEMGIVAYFEIVTPFMDTLATDTAYFFLSSNDGAQDLPSIPKGIATEDYRIFSIPFELDNKKIDVHFADEFETDRYGIDWRLFGYDTKNASYQEYNAGLSEFSLGSGYWLATKFGTQISVGDGVPVQVTPDAPYKLSIQKGYNLIGCPYNFPVDWTEVVSANKALGIEVGELLVYDGSYSTGATLENWSGGFLYSDQDVEIVIPIARAVETDDSNARRSGINRLENNSDEEWLLPVSIQSPSTKEYTLSGIGMSKEASDRYDSKDIVKVPALGNTHLLTFQTKTEEGTPLTRSIVSSSEFNRWVFEVKAANDHEFTTIKWDSEVLRQLGKEVYLFDIIEGRVVDMKTQDKLSYQSSSAERTFKIIYGDQKSIEQEMLEEGIIFSNLFPNPANSSTTLTIQTGVSGIATLKIIDILGKELSMVTQLEITKGISKNQLDLTALPSGVYYLEVNFKGAVQRHRFIKK